ncbi:MAG: dipeptidase PepV [Firmicutes bacterium]|nr:dipeptidase PepV [Bacillota bacterium]
MEYLDLVLNKIEENRDEQISCLQELIRIKSVEEPAKGDMPFGEGVHGAYTYMMEKCSREGFAIKNADNYGGHAELSGSGDKVFGIVGHLDVVPEGHDWEEDPYGGLVKDGFIYGRGTTDNKGPMVAAYYAMRAIKECGVPMRDTVRLIFGLDEETNWAGMEHYIAKLGVPDYGITPDADFPAIHGEKGIMVFDLAKKFMPATAKGLELRSVKGGTAPNMVADSARAVVRDTSGAGYDMIRAQVAAKRNKNHVTINCRGIGTSFELTAEGVAAHGAKPEAGKNAISVLMEFLGELNFVNEDAAVFVDFYNQHIGYETDGHSLGCGFSDGPSGKLILNVGMIDLDHEAVKLTINARYPVTMHAEDVYEGIVPVTDKFNLGIIKGKNEDPIYIPADDPMIVTLMDVYKKHTGDTESSPLVIGGGTYARAFENVIAFGAMFPGDPDLMHQKNERISIDNFMLMTKIFAEAIIRLAGETE